MSFFQRTENFFGFPRVVFRLTLVLLGGCERVESEPEASQTLTASPAVNTSATPREPVTDPPAGPASAVTEMAEVEKTWEAWRLTADLDVHTLSVRAQQAYLLELLAETEALTLEQRSRLEAIFSASEWLGFGSPKRSRGALSREQCLERWTEASSAPPSRAPSGACRGPNMSLVPDERGAGSICVDRFEFPNVRCEYPVVWARSSEAGAICQVLGKRLCDAHEWEGACAGVVLDPAQAYGWERLPEAPYSSARPFSASGKAAERQRRLSMEYNQNHDREIRWAYGTQRAHELCATGSHKSETCSVVDFETCGTNSYPAGAFPDCVSSAGVFDQHGNAAEHMSLPLHREQLAHAGGVGFTEMKGSWFIFGREEAHPDDCRWRARNWHTTLTVDPNSHRNYHLGFRCCAESE